MADDDVTPLPASSPVVKISTKQSFVAIIFFYPQRAVSVLSDLSRMATQKFQCCLTSTETIRLVRGEHYAEVKLCPLYNDAGRTALVLWSKL